MRQKIESEVEKSYTINSKSREKQQRVEIEFLRQGTQENAQLKNKVEALEIIVEILTHQVTMLRTNDKQLFYISTLYCPEGKPSGEIVDGFCKVF